MAEWLAGSRLCWGEKWLNEDQGDNSGRKCARWLRVNTPEDGARAR